ncbi:MAG TPA: STAS domain-containing protein [Planctomycetota bacterium]|nr:STAS domain-containing protein [Planctomycetota bacterium]
MELTIQSIIYQHAEVGDVVLLKPCGPIDQKSLQIFEAKVLGFYRDGICKIILDLSETKYLNSTGLGLLINIAQRVHVVEGGIRLINVANKFKVLFDMLGLEVCLPIMENLDKALISFKQNNGKPISASDFKIISSCTEEENQKDESEKPTQEKQIDSLTEKDNDIDEHKNHKEDNANDEDHDMDENDATNEDYDMNENDATNEDYDRDENSDSDEDHANDEDHDRDNANNEDYDKDKDSHSDEDYQLDDITTDKQEKNIENTEDNIQEKEYLEVQEKQDILPRTIDITFENMTFQEEFSKEEEEEEEEEEELVKPKFIAKPPHIKRTVPFLKKTLLMIKEDLEKKQQKISTEQELEMEDTTEKLDTEYEPSPLEFLDRLVEEQEPNYNKIHTNVPEHNMTFSHKIHIQEVNFSDIPLESPEQDVLEDQEQYIQLEEDAEQTKQKTKTTMSDFDGFTTQELMAMQPSRRKYTPDSIEPVSATVQTIDNLELPMPTTTIDCNEIIETIEEKLPRKKTKTSSKKSSIDSQKYIILSVAKTVEVQYFSKMKYTQTYPMSVTIKGELLPIEDTNKYILILPQFPGCDVYPDQTLINISKETKTVEFWITPITKGCKIVKKIPASIDLFYCKRHIEHFNTPYKITSYMKSAILFLLTLIVFNIACFTQYYYEVSILHYILFGLAALFGIASCLSFFSNGTKLFKMTKKFILKIRKFQ